MKDFFTNDIARFLYKVVAIFLGWFVLYELWILPNGYIDGPLSHNIAAVSAGLLQAMGESVFYYGRVVGLHGANGIEIVNGCNGITAIGLFLGFILAYPGDRRSRLFFSILGIALIYIVNVLRIVALAYIQLYQPSYYSFSHDYSTTTIFYVIIFLLWMVWANYGDTTLQKQTALQPA
ncbi:MAG: exosortase X [Balneolaceae bacterium]